MKSVSLFTGIGGFDVGFRSSGIKAHMFAEVDPHASAVLQRHFPDVSNVGDIRRLKELPPSIDVLAAGFPCQDLSQAGLRSGLEGERSGLIAEVFRLLKKRRVPWVVIENVPFMLHLQRGHAIEAVTTQLERLGYRWAYRVIDALAFGLPQRRKRLFLVASTDGDPRSILHASDHPREASPPQPFGRHPVGFYWTEGNRGVGWAEKAIPTLKGASGHGIPSPPAIAFPDGRIVQPTIDGAERLQGFDAGWTRLEAGTMRPRWRMVGNAVSVRVATWIGERLASGAHEDVPDGDRFEGGTWPSAAYGERGRRFAVSLSEFPARRAVRSLEEVLRGRTAPLSRGAAAGFLDRLIRSNLRQREDKKFLAVLRRHISTSDPELADAAE